MNAYSRTLLISAILLAAIIAGSLPVIFSEHITGGIILFLPALIGIAVLGDKFIAAAKEG